jgi:maleylacetate reductase
MTGTSAALTRGTSAATTLRTYEFTHTAGPARVVFGRGSIDRSAEEVERLGCRRALVLTTPQQAQQGEELAVSLGGLAVGVFSGAVMHTPVTVTDTAVSLLLDTRADCVVALGGGSTTGLGKAVAGRTGTAQVVIPTTYAGSEVTPILGETENGIKTTRRGPEILPETVIYDPQLTDSLPVSLSVTSGLNAMAHALEGLYARDGSPVYSVMAAEALAAFRSALPILVKAPQDHEARDAALYGAWLCGTVLGGVGMSVHHKLCHTLGGTLDLPHAETHAILLPHTIAYVADTVRNELRPAADLFGNDVGAGLYDFAGSLDAPQRLADLGVAQADLDRVTDLALANPYWSPRRLEYDSVHALLYNAWAGERPR